MNQLIFRLVLHLKITIWTSVLWKMKNTVGKKMAIYLVRFISDQRLQTLYYSSKFWKEVHLANAYFSIRYLTRFFDCWAHQTMYAYIGNKHFVTKMCCRQTYQNSKISWQKKPISDLQSEFSMSKIIQIFLIFFQ